MHIASDGTFRWPIVVTNGSDITLYLIRADVKLWPNPVVGQFENARS